MKSRALLRQKPHVLKRKNGRVTNPTSLFNRLINEFDIIFIWFCHSEKMAQGLLAEVVWNAEEGECLV